MKPDICPFCGADKGLRPDHWRRASVKIAALRMRDGDECYLCAFPILFNLRLEHPCGPSVDHVVPKHRRGCSCLSNIKLTHHFCNNKKQEQSAEAFIVYRAKRIRGYMAWTLIMVMPKNDPRRPEILKIAHAHGVHARSKARLRKAENAARWHRERLGYER